MKPITFNESLRILLTFPTFYSEIHSSLVRNPSVKYQSLKVRNPSFTDSVEGFPPFETRCCAPKQK